VEVEFNLENLKKCLCDCCPVQNKTRCVLDKMKIIQEISQDDLDSRIMIEKERVPAIYCAGGKATLNNVDSIQECQCDKCRVWKEKNLFSGEPPGYFCRDGKSMQ
jgi:hypothetical protein